MVLKKIQVEVSRFEWLKKKGGQPGSFRIAEIVKAITFVCFEQGNHFIDEVCLAFMGDLLRVGNSSVEKRVRLRLL